MAFVMGRSCSYGVHLRACFPSAPSSSTSSHSPVSLSRLASCFFLRFSSSSCRTRRLKLCAAYSRSTAVLIHTDTEQAGSSTTGSASRLRQLPTMKQASSEVEAGKEHVSSVEEESHVGAISRKRATKRKKVVSELLLEQTLEDGVASDEVVATSKKSSVRKKTEVPTLDTTVMDSPADEEAPRTKSRQRKKPSISGDVESKREISSCKLEGRVELTDSIDLASSSTSSLPLGSSKRSPRKKKALTPVLPLEEIIDAVVGATQVKTASKKKSSDEATTDSPVRKARKKKVSSSSMPVEEITNSATDIDLASSSTSSLPLGSSKRSPRKKKALTSVLPLEEIIDAVAGATQAKTASKEESSDGATTDSPVRKARKKKVSSSFMPVEEAINSAMDTIQDNKSLKGNAKDMDEVIRDTPKTKARKKVVLSLSLTEEMSAGTEIDTMKEKQTVEEIANSETDMTHDNIALRGKSNDANDMGGVIQDTTKRKASKTVVSSSSLMEEISAGTEMDTTKEKQTAVSLPISSELLKQDESGFLSRGHQMAPGRAPTREGTYNLNVNPATHEKRQESNSQHWSRWSKNSRRGATEAAVQRHEASYRQQFVKTEQRETHLQQGYALANIDRAHGRERKKRKDFFVRNIVANQASTISYMQIFGTGFDTGDTLPTMLLFFDRRRFLFNVGEGLHRFCMEHKFKLSKIDHVFLTRVCSETVGGLPGLILTLAEMNETGLTVKTWGPSSLDDLAQAMRVFVPSGWMEHTHSFGPGENDSALSKSISASPVVLLEDELIKISAVLLYSEDTSISNTNLLSPASQKDGHMLSTVYICELSTVRGKFDLDKAQAKGLRPGYKYGKLQKGESVMSDDGTTMVHPEDVLGPSSPGPIMFVVDCPSTSYVSSLTSSTSLQSFFSETGKIVNCMIHIGPTSVTLSKDYQAWMENFKETHHIMAQPEVKVLGTPTLTSWTKTLWKLNLVCPWLFPVVEIDAKKKKEAGSSRMVAGDNLLKYRFRPLSDLGLDNSEVPEAVDYAAAQEKWDKLSPEVLKARDMARQVWKRWSGEKSVKSGWKDRSNRNSQCLPKCLHQVSREEMELVFLGTGSSQPSKHRNVTGIYIHLFKRGGVLLDCGEGTFAQLKRRYGAKGADDVLLGLKCIWISHLHADHFTGILRILSARKALLQARSRYEPIMVIGPKKLKCFLDSYGKIENLGMEFLDCSQTTSEVQRWADAENAEDRVAHKKEGLIHWATRGASEKNGMQHIWKQPGYHIQQGIDIEGRKRLKAVLDRLGLKGLYSVPVIHCPNAFAVVLEAQDRKVSENATKPGWKLVFSGDTRPCQALVEAAQNATILIHEATFEDDLIAEAVKKNHSITLEAMKVGVDAGVYRIFLTHFSQRYPTIPYFDNQFKDRACMAFDMMSVNLADLPIVPEFLPALQMLFRDRSDAEEETDGAHALSV